MRLRQIIATLALLVAPPGTMAVEADCLFVEAAKLAGVWPPASMGAIAPADLNAIHRVVHGTGTVVLIRSFSGKKGETSDSEEFWKLTIDLPNIALGETRSLQATAANTRFSRAGSAWVAKGFGYVGARVSGRIVARRVDSATLQVDVSLDVETRFAGDPEEAQPQAIQKKVTLQRIGVADLTPWLGLASAGATDYWASHRPKDRMTSCSERP